MQHQKGLATLAILIVLVVAVLGVVTYSLSLAKKELPNSKKVTDEELYCDKNEDCVLTSYTYECCGNPCAGETINMQTFEKRKQWTVENCEDEDYNRCPSVNCMRQEDVAVCENKECVRKTIFNDPNISFTYHSDWVITTNEPSQPFFYSADFIGDCGKNRIVSFTYKITDVNDPQSMDLGLKNPRGPANQTSRTLKINGITMGENVQPSGDGSGGYEPKVVIDFLSISKDVHFYFTAVKGCRDSFEDTYKQDLLPILNSVELIN